MTKSKLMKPLISVLAVLIGILIGSVILLITGGLDAFLEFFGALYNSTIGSPKSLGNWLYMCVPLVLCGLSVSFAYRVGLFNIGAEGQFIVASIVAIILGIQFDFPGAWFVILIIATISGMLYALIPGVLKAYFNISEVVTTIMLNWIAFIYVNQYLITDVYNNGVSFTQTAHITDSASINSDFLRSLTDNSFLNLGFIFMLLGIIVYWFTMEKTAFGYELKAVGYSPFAAKYAGVKSKISIVYTMMISGMFAGLAGAIYSLGDPGFTTITSTFRNFGFDGIGVAMLGQLNAFGILFSGMFFGALRQSQSYMISTPKEIVDVIMAIIIICSAFGAILYKKFGGK